MHIFVFPQVDFDFRYHRRDGQLFLSATYSGNLIAFLTVTKEKPPFDSLSEMVAQDEYEWGTLGGTYWMTWFEVRLLVQRCGNSF
jgi:hypothetical protein